MPVLENVGGLKVPVEHTSPVIPGVYQGSYHAGRGHRLYDLHIGTARERRPPKASAVVVLHLPLDDDRTVDWVSDTHWLRTVTKVAREAAEEVLDGGRVLITCNMGLNRSGLLVALTLLYLGISRDRAISLVRRARGPDSLSNERFLEVIRAVALYRRRARARRRVPSVSW